MDVKLDKSELLIIINKFLLFINNSYFIFSVLCISVFLALIIFMPSFKSNFDTLYKFFSKKDINMDN